MIKDLLDYYYNIKLHNTINYNINYDKTYYKNKVLIPVVFSSHYSYICFRLQIQSIYKYMKNKYHFICVDCNDEEVYSCYQIKNYCLKNNISYIKYPNIKNFNKKESFGIVLNWIFRNIVTLFEPRCFLFMHQDLIFKKECEVDNLCGEDSPYTFSGRRVQSPYFSWAWHLGSEYMLYYYNHVKNMDFDFFPAPELELYDTGGTNAFKVFRFTEDWVNRIRIVSTQQYSRIYDSILGSNFYTLGYSTRIHITNSDKIFKNKDFFNSVLYKEHLFNILEKKDYDFKE